MLPISSIWLPTRITSIPWPSILQRGDPSRRSHGAEYIVVHPGAYTDKDAEYGINRIADALNTIIHDDQKITICLETMAGKGTEIGRTFEELTDHHRQS